MKIKDIIVKTIPQKKLMDFLNIKLSENEELDVNSFAVYESKFMIDTDCCFSEIENAHIDNSIKPVLEIPCRIRKYKANGSYSIRMDKPDFVKSISLDDFFERATEVKLIDFIRYNYNPRIISNQNLLMKYIKE